MLISAVINADTRIGWDKPESTIGDYGEGSLQGCRSVDFLLDGVRNKMNYFRGYDCQCILYIDQHNPIPDKLFMEICALVHSFGNNSRVICKEHNRTKYRWYDYITIEALRWAEGTHICHWDSDTSAIRTDDCRIVEDYLHWLESGYKFICQPSRIENHGMYWASTRFFICKKESLNLSLLEQSLYTPLNDKHSPCLEHAIGILSGDNTVLYPPMEEYKYLIWSWVRYFYGTLKKLNNIPPIDALKYIIELGCHGANDVVDKKTNV